MLATPSAKRLLVTDEEPASHSSEHTYGIHTNSCWTAVPELGGKEFAKGRPQAGSYTVWGLVQRYAALSTAAACCCGEPPRDVMH